MAKKEKKETFEEALTRLEETADSLEHGDLPLDQSLKKYEEGVEAYRYCAALLKEVEHKIEILTKENGELKTVDAPELEPQD